VFDELRRQVESPAEGDMARIIAITNQKGGVGKTTTAINLSACMATLGRKVLMVDMDPQGNATSGVGIERADISECVYDVIIGGFDPRRVIRPGPIEGMEVLPSTLDLAAAEIELASEISRETRLRAGLEPLREDYEYIVIDCPPALGLLTINSLAAASETLIPIQSEYYALEGLVYLFGTVQRVKRHVNSGLKISGVLLTMFDVRTNLSKDVEKEVRREYPRLTMRTVIPRAVRLSEAPAYGKPIILYEPSAKGALAYMELAKEVVQSGEEGPGQGTGRVDRFGGVEGGTETRGYTGKGDKA